MVSRPQWPDALEPNTCRTSTGGCEIVNTALSLEVPFLDLKAQYRALAPEINRAVADVLESAQFVGGPFVENFEQDFASYIFFFQAEDGIRDHCVTGVQTCALPI